MSLTAGPPAHLLLERERELAAMGAAQDDADVGNGRIVLIEGRAGVGKSAVLGHASRSATERGFEVVAARASELEQEYPFGVVRQLFEQRVRTARGWLDGSAAAAATAFEPAWATDTVLGFDDVSHAVLHGLYWLTVNACTDQTVLLAVDDVQWCDRPSLRFLSYLGRRLEGLRLLVVLGVRSSELSRNDALMAELAREPWAVLVEPAPLTPAGVGQLLQARLGGTPRTVFTTACHRATGGNPLLLDELARAMHTDGVRPETANVDVVADLGPRAVSRTVLMRLARLDADAVALARAVSVLGDGGGLAMLGGMTGLGGPTIEKAARALIGAEVLRPEAPLGFVHPLIRDAVYHEMSPLERESRHAHAARLLRDAGRPAEHVAAHALVLPPAGQRWVVESLHEAARIAVHRGAAESAVSYLRRALDEPADPDQQAQLVLELGMVEALANEPQAAADHLTRAYRASTDPNVRGRVAEVLARMLIFTNPPQDAVAVAQEAQRGLPEELVDLRQALAAVELYTVNFGADDHDTSARLTRLRQDAVGDGPGARMLTAVAAWDLALTGGHVDACAPLALAALGDGVLVAADPAFMTIVAAGVLVLADREEALDTWAAALAEGHTRGSRLAVSGVHLWQGWGWLQRGALAEAEDSLRQYIVETELREGEGEAGMAYCSGFLTRVLVEQGRLTDARKISTWPAESAFGSDGDLLLRRGVIELLLAEGNWRTALAALDDYGARLRRITNPAWAPLGSLQARALCGLGHTEQAVERAADEVTAARRWGAAGTVGPSLRALGTALDANGSAACLEVLEEAVALTAASPARLEHAKSLAAFGSALRRRGRPADARVPLLRAVDLATMCGAGPLADTATAELLAAGGRRPRPGATGPEALTPSERRVAVLASVGRTNKAIAQELFVTPKTVEVHLSSAYRKLGITSRGELPTAGL